jgi:hypothetical protein
MTRLTTTFILLFLTIATFGQTRKDLTNLKIYGNSKKKSSFLFANPSPFLRYPDFLSYLPKVKYEFGSVQSINVGLTTIDFDGELPQRYNGPFIESGITLSEPRHLMCNKVGYEYFSMVMWGGRLNVVHYTDFHSNQFFVRPEIGYSLLSLVTLTYGYNFKLPGNSDLIKPGSIYSINLALPIYKKEYRDME